MTGRRMHVALAMTLPLALAGCEHAVIGNSVALGMALCLFVGTLQLGRRPAPARDEARSPATQTRH